MGHGPGREGLAVSLRLAVATATLTGPTDTPSPVEPPRRQFQFPVLRDWAVPASAGAALVLWCVGLRPVTPGQLGSVGLVTALSPVLLASYPVLLAAVLIELTAPRPRQRLLAACTALGVLLVYGLQPASEQTARLSAAWLHVGFIRYIADHGQVLPAFDARFSWPGFFSLFALVSRAAGVPDVTPLLQWAPTVLAGLATLGIRALVSNVLDPGRTAWIATWLFVLTEWTEQDYFSPQATTYVLMLAALALTLRYLVAPRLAAVGPGVLRGRVVPSGTPGQRLAVQGAVLLLALALAPSHQLTPYVLGGLLLIMLLARRLWAGWLPWLVLLLALGWFSLGAKDFWQGQLQMVIGGFGDVSASFNQGVSGRFVGDAGRQLILLVRVGLAGAVGALALAGGWLLRCQRRLGWVLGLLAAAPFGLIALQSYGGEVFLRCYLFSLPFAVILAAVAVEALLRPSPDAWVLRPSPKLPPSPRRRALRLIPVLALLTGLGLGTVMARGGNDAYTSFGRADVAAVDYAYQHARTGQHIEAVTSDVPLSSARVGEVGQSTLETFCPGLVHVSQCVLDTHPDFLLVTPSQENDGRIYYDLPAGWTSALVTELTASGRYRVVFDQDGSQVLARVVPPTPNEPRKE